MDLAWEQHYQTVKQYVEQTGSTDIPKEMEDADGVRLHRWISRQLKYAQKGQLSADKAKRLMQLGFVPDQTDPFEAGFSHAKAYFETYDDLLVRSGYICEDGFRLSSWIRNMRGKKEKLTAEIISRLETIGMIWNVSDYHWKRMYESAVQFYRKAGHLKVPVHYRDSDGKDLYEWIQGQKKGYRLGKLSSERVSLLRKIGLFSDEEAGSDLHISKRKRHSGDAGRRGGAELGR